MRYLRLDVVHQVAARAHRTQHGGVGDGRALVAVHAAVHHGGEAEGHEKFRVREFLAGGDGPGERHRQRKRHGVGAPARSGGKGDDHCQNLQQHGQQKVRNALAEQLDQEDAAASLLADAADSDGEQENDRTEDDALEALVNSRHQHIERHALGQRHPRRQKKRRAEGPLHVGRVVDDEGADRDAYERNQGQEELEDMWRVALGDVAGL